MKSEWTRKKLINAYIEFFKSKGHKEIPNASLIPQNDPTVLFITAGMHPLVPYLSGQEHSQGKKLTSVQRCIRTGDIDEIGDSFHHTFFEMLGNWSLGDYGKKEAIEYSFEFLTKILKIPLERLAVSVFAGDKDCPRDEESAKIWKSLGISPDRIAYLPKEDNWWGPAGKTGPCGPDTEMFYWKINEKKAPKNFDPKDKNWVEIWNDVFMTYTKEKDGKYLNAKQKNVDTGMGVERTVAVLNGLEDNYLGDMWRPIIDEIEHLSGKKYESYKKEMRIISDHVKASVFMMADGVTPSNTEQGYVLRRLIRRAIMKMGKLGFVGTDLINPIAEKVFIIYKDYEQLGKKKEEIFREIDKEEERFDKTLESGLKIFEKLCSNNNEVSGKDAFLLFQSYGFPIEMTVELAKEKGIEVDLEGYREELAKHQELSRTSTEGKFKSGLADHSVQTTRLHTATHLFLAAVNKILPKPAGQKEILQRGSNITAERARFDFTYERKLTEEEVKNIESQINSWIETGSQVERKEMNLEEAKKMGAMGIFEEKYKKSDIISVYVIGGGDISKELCTGPHVKSLAEMQGLKFKIASQESVGAGVRRVKIILEPKN
jgi:alanyl-tRNA synthetase